MRQRALPALLNTLVAASGYTLLGVLVRPAFSLVSVIANVGAFLLCLVIATFLHEVAHLTVARAVGMRVPTFEVGCGRAVWRRTLGGTRVVRLTDSWNVAT